MGKTKRIITGNSLANLLGVRRWCGDPRETIANAWPAVQEVLESRGIVHPDKTTNRLQYFGDITKYNGESRRSDGFGNLKEEWANFLDSELSKSPANFIRNIEQFGYELFYRGIYSGRAHIGRTGFRYTNNPEKSPRESSSVTFDIFPAGWFSFSNDFFNNCSDARERLYDRINRARDPSILIVRAYSDVKCLDEELKKAYRTARRLHS